MSERKPSPFKTLLDSDVCTLIEAADEISVALGYSPSRTASSFATL